MQSPPPTEYFEGIQFNPYYYQSWYEPVTKLYVDTNFLKCVGYAYSRAIATSFSGVITADGGIQTTNINASGLITSTFKGSGAQLTSINASNISSGTLNVVYGGTGVNTFAAKRILIGDGTNPITTTANLIYDTSTNTLIPINIAANGSGLTNLNASNVSDGTLAVTRGGTGLNTLPLNQILIGNNTTSIFSTSLLRWDPTTDNLIGKFTGSGAGLSSLNANNFISGTLPVDFGGTGVNSFIADRLLIGGTTAISQSGNLTWNGTTNILTALNIAGNGSRLTNLNTSNVSDGTLTVARGGTGASTFTAGRLLIGNGASAITEDPELTWNGTTNILTVTGTGAITTVSATNIGIGITNPTTSSIEIVRPVTTVTDLINMRYDANNGVRFQQAFVAANDVKYNIIQKHNNVDINAMTFYRGNIGIGTTAPVATDKLSVTGNTKITGTATIDTNLVVGGSAGIVGTGNFTGNVGIGTGTIATNVLQVGAGGRLRIANNNTDFTLIGSTDVDGNTNTSIVISGSSTETNAGNIQYLATAANGSHLFYTTVPTTLRMTISNTGVNINNNLSVSGNVSIGTTTTSDIDDNTAFAIPTSLLYVKGGDSAGGTCNVVIKGGNLNGNNGKARLWLTANNGHSSYIESEHTGSGNTYLAFGTANGNVLPTERMRIDNVGNVSINNELTVSGNKSVITGGSPTLYLRHSTSRSAMIHNNNNILYFLGGAANSDNWTQINNLWPLEINLTNNNAFFGGNVSGLGLTSRAAIEAQNYILTNNGFYARSSYDTRMFSNSGGMYIDMGNIGTDGNPSYFRMGAYNGVNNIEGLGNRNLRLIVRNGDVNQQINQRWEFRSSGECFNSFNWTTWNTTSDQRVKENIKKADLKICFNNVKNINLYRYNYINGFSSNTTRDKTQLGFVAQQVSQHFPKSVLRSKTRIEDKREINDLASVSIDQINMSLFGAVKQLIRVVEKQSKRIKKLEELLNIIDDDEVEDDTDEPYIKIECDEVDINTIEPSEPEGV